LLLAHSQIATTSKGGRQGARHKPRKGMTHLGFGLRAAPRAAAARRGAPLRRHCLGAALGERRPRLRGRCRGRGHGGPSALWRWGFLGVLQAAFGSTHSTPWPAENMMTNGGRDGIKKAGGPGAPPWPRLSRWCGLARGRAGPCAGPRAARVFFGRKAGRRWEEAGGAR
jgi:hypothetical protein